MFRIVSLPPFQAAASDVDPHWDFSPKGILGQFNAYFSKITPELRDSFAPRDFLYYDAKRGGAIWMYALAPGMDAGGHDIIDFEGGYYLTYAYWDGDEKARVQCNREAMDYIEKSDRFELDNGRFAMGHIITPHEITVKFNWAQMEAFIPIKLKQ